MSKKNELSKKDAQKWANALRSGKYKQAKSMLQTSEGYCCLGVACEIFIPRNKQVRHGGLLDGAMPYSQPESPLWLETLPDSFYNRVGGTSIINLNDSQDFTFDEIADVIELVYVHKAL